MKNMNEISYSELKFLQKVSSKNKQLTKKLKYIEQEIIPNKPASAIYILFCAKPNQKYDNTRPTSNTVDIIDEYAEMYEVCCELDGDGCDCTTEEKLLAQALHYQLGNRSKK